MGFYLIVKKTFLSMLGWKRTLSLVVLGTAIPIYSGWNDWNTMVAQEGLPALTMQTQFVADRIGIMWYIWGAGFLLAIMLVSSAAGFISKEVTEGTMMVLAAKPVSRYQIILGKLLALMVYAMLLLAFTYTFSILLLWGILGLDIDSLQVLLGLLPAFLLYGLLVTLFFASITTALSALIASRIKIMVVSMVLLILAFFGGSILRIMLFRYDTSQYQQSNVHSVDIGYHLGNTYDLVTRSVSFWQMSPHQLKRLGDLNGTYGDPTYTSADGLGTLYLPNHTNYLNPAFSLIIILLVSTGATGLAVWGFNRKQL